MEVKVGLSYTSIENARFNRETEAADVTFDQAKKNATDVWNESLSRIYVEGGKETDKVKFYTGLFHALLGRGLASDAMDIILKIMERSVVLLLMKKVIRYISIIIRMPFGVVSGI